MKRWGTELRLGLSRTSSSSTSPSRPHSYDDQDQDEPPPAAAAAVSDWSPVPNNINYNNINGAPSPTQQMIRINEQSAESSSSSADAPAVGVGNTTHFFVKVYMEGIPIGRKLDLFAHHGYHELVTTLTHMFRTTILYPGIDRVHYDQDHVLTYEDKEGDLMMVGDVPWDLFLSTVKKLKITRADNC